MSRSAIAAVAAVMVLASCGENPASTYDILVTEPHSGQTWRSWQGGFTVEWVPAGGDSVSISLCSPQEIVGELAASTENDGFFYYEDCLPWGGESGGGYRILVSTQGGKYGYSDEFIIDNDIDVLSPSEGDTWYRCGGDHLIEWTPSTSLKVWLDLFLNGEKVLHIAYVTQGEGSYLWEDSIPLSVVPGEDYRIRISDMNGYHGDSQSFCIEESVPGPAGIEFALMPAGEFDMGAPLNEEGSTDHERPVHRVSIDYSFQISVTEITQEQWTAVMGSNPSHFQGPGNPVENVSWDDCQDFVQELNLMDPEWTYRLPSEAEWEYSCRAGTHSRFYWGMDMDGSCCWFSGNSQGTTQETGSTVPNIWGLRDMSGNVLEWCQDNWHEDYEGAPSDGSAWTGGVPEYRVVRGGCWGFGPDLCRSAFRFRYDYWCTSDYLGLRVVRTR